MTADELMISVHTNTMEQLCFIEADILDIGGDLVDIQNHSNYIATIGPRVLGEFSADIVDDDTRRDSLTKSLFDKWKVMPKYEPNYELLVSTDSNIIYSKIILYLHKMKAKDRCFFLEFNRG